MVNHPHRNKHRLQPTLDRLAAARSVRMLTDAEAHQYWVLLDYTANRTIAILRAVTYGEQIATYRQDDWKAVDVIPETIDEAYASLTPDMIHLLDTGSRFGDWRRHAPRLAQQESAR